MTVIVANGEKPKSEKVLAMLARAEHVVACDGAGAWVRGVVGGREVPPCGSTTLAPTMRSRVITIGDGRTGGAEAAGVWARRTGGAEAAAPSSVAALPPVVVIGDGDSGTCDVVVSEQETNDLAKAYRYCVAQGWGDIVVIGATGLREDHALGNIFRCLEWGLTIVSDYGTFVPCEGAIILKNLRPGQGVSIFATDPATEMTSEGLQWPLKGVKFTNLYCATLNRAIGGDVTLTSNRRVYVYVEA